jgi:hypothetical protein
MAALIGSGCLTIAFEAVADPGDGGGANNQEQAAEFSDCMRTNGVADFPDPNPEGQFAYGGISVPPAVWEKAVGACKNLQPGLFDGPGRTRSPCRHVTICSPPHYRHWALASRAETK